MIRSTQTELQRRKNYIKANFTGQNHHQLADDLKISINLIYLYVQQLKLSYEKKEERKIERPAAIYSNKSFI